MCVMGETLVRCRTTTPGSVLELMVLASGRRSCIGVDLDSGALIRTVESISRPLLKIFTAVRGTTAQPSFDRPEHPELVAFDQELLPIGSIAPKRAQRMIKPLLHPKQGPLLGFYGPSTPWWEREANAPSVAILEVDRRIRAIHTPRGLRVQFAWNGSIHDLPLEDLRVLERLDWVPEQPNATFPLAEIIRYEPRRLLLAISRPVNGYCTKVVAGLLP